MTAERDAWRERARHLARSVRDLQAARDTWRERWRQLMRDHEAVVKERDELQAENERLRTALRRKENHRARARERARQRDEVIERVRGALAGHPECDRYPNDGGEPILCGWKRAVVDVRAALEGDGR